MTKSWSIPIGQILHGGDILELCGGSGTGKSEVGALVLIGDEGRLVSCTFPQPYLTFVLIPHICIRGSFIYLKSRAACATGDTQDTNTCCLKSQIAMHIAAKVLLRSLRTTGRLIKVLYFDNGESFTFAHWEHVIDWRQNATCFV